MDAVLPSRSCKAYPAPRTFDVYCVNTQDHYTEAEAHGLICTLAQVMHFTHEKGVVHRDIKVRLAYAVILPPVTSSTPIHTASHPSV